jgi:hypothetical protein
MEPVTMSVPESTPLSDADVESLPALPHALERLTDYVVPPVRFVAFWVATLLPFAYVPLLATNVVVERPLGFLGLLAVNVVAFVLGHSYKR